MGTFSGTAILMFSFLPPFSIKMGVVAHNSQAMVLGNFQCQDVLLIWIITGQGLVVGAVGLFGYFFISRLSFLFSFSLSLGDGLM